MPILTFNEYLIIGLAALLFADKYIPAVLQKLGWMKKNGNGYAEIIENHEKRLEVANSEMGDVRELLVGITTKVDIIMRHLNL
jgi:hypothetical protein